MKYFCVFGNPIAHSLSPLIHNAVFVSFDLDWVYSRFCLEKAKELKSTFHRLHLSGANITLPFKEEAFVQADEIQGIAKHIGAVNTWVAQSNQSNKEAKIIGYNTDAEGFLATIQDKGFKRALILGAGGSAKAVAFILKHSGFEVQVANRSDTRAKDFCDNAIPYCVFEELRLESYDLIINATSASIQNTLPLAESKLKELFCNAQMAYDLMYGRESAFLQLAKTANIKTKDGRDMLIMQAVYAYILFARAQGLTTDVQEHRIYTIMNAVMP